METENVFLLKKKLNDFLKEYPELKPLQEKIDKQLKGAVTPHNRLVILNKLLMNSVNELNAAIKDLLTLEIKK